MFPQDHDNQMNYGQNPESIRNACNPQPEQPANGMSNYVNYYSDPGEVPKKKKSVGKAIAKTIAGVAAIALVSASSIQLYKYFGDREGSISTSDKTHEDNIAYLNEDKPDEDEPEETSAAEDEDEDAQHPATPSVNWITMATPEDALTIPEIVEKAMPSVVGVSAVFEGEPDGYYGFYDYFGGGGQTQQYTGTGTGIVMSSDGYIITNAHVIYDSTYDYGAAVSVTVLMSDESEYEAEIVGYDLETDLAVLKVDASGLVAAEFGSSEELQVGEMVVAIGNPLGFELFGTTTCGIVSAMNREIVINEKKMSLIQTDAAINSGNSGGPLLNCYGQVIGINSAKMSCAYSSASVEGLGFAIPISDAATIINDLVNYGYVAGRPQIGITSMDIDESTAYRFNMPQGVYVYSVTEGGAAEKAGLQVGDVIIGIEDTAVTTTEELNAVKNEYNAGDTIALRVYRAGEEINVQITLEEVVQPQS